jgi:hypothetical protein
MTAKSLPVQSIFVDNLPAAWMFVDNLPVELIFVPSIKDNCQSGRHSANPVGAQCFPLWHIQWNGL